MQCDGARRPPGQRPGLGLTRALVRNKRSGGLIWAIFNTSSVRADRNTRFATAAEMQSTFDTEHTNLEWIALVITGDPLLAQKSVVDASGLHRTSSSVFRDWLTRWAHSVTAREAARNVKELSATSVPRYSNWACAHIDHPPLSAEDAAFVRKISPLEIAVNLDPLARSILVLRGIQSASFSDCSMLINASRRAVTGAYCHAVEWLHQYAFSGNFDTSAPDVRPSGIADMPR